MSWRCLSYTFSMFCIACLWSAVAMSRPACPIGIDLYTYMSPKRHKVNMDRASMHLNESLMESWHYMSWIWQRSCVFHGLCYTLYNIICFQMLFVTSAIRNFKFGERNKDVVEFNFQFFSVRYEFVVYETWNFLRKYTSDIGTPDAVKILAQHICSGLPAEQLERQSLRYAHDQRRRKWRR